uniref:PDZ domain-containing protein n=1 Tax=Setaria italica TaxID=4555 RepID=K4AIS3_SETIT
MAESWRDPVLREPPAKRRDIDPIAPTKHPWNLPARLSLPHCSCNPEDSYVAIPREANLPIDEEARRVVAGVSQAVVAVASIDVSFSFRITEKPCKRNKRQENEIMQTLKRYCRPSIMAFGVNLHNAQSSPWMKVPTTLHEGLDGLVVELALRAASSVGLRQRDLIIQCNGRRVATSLQLFEILVENIGKMVELTVIKAEDGTAHSIHLPVEETVEKNFYSWPISNYHGGFL